MQYLLLIYTAEDSWQKLSETEARQMIAEYNSFSDSVVKSGHFRAGQRLGAVATATTVRVRDGKTLTSDGPFAETREQLGGYYLIEAGDLDQAIAIAERIPGARLGSIEVRPVMDTVSAQR